jgi:Flp pilus assembly pilin Flp
MRRFLDDESGTTAIEYAIIGMCIFLAIVTSLTTLGARLAAVFPVIADVLK